MSKKWDKKVEVEGELNWRPDFRDRQSLPDIKPSGQLSSFRL